MTWNMSLRASRTLLRTAVLALCAPTMHGQTANTGAIASGTQTSGDEKSHQSKYGLGWPGKCQKIRPTR